MEVKNCPHCASADLNKAGVSRHGHRRWLCKACKRTFGNKNYRRIEPEIKEQALALYAEGVCARAIERLLGISHNSVLGWVKREVSQHALHQPAAHTLHTVEMDEMWSYVGSKKSRFGCGGP